MPSKGRHRVRVTTSFLPKIPGVFLVAFSLKKITCSLPCISGVIDTTIICF